jgi:hypothetical protein
MWLWGDGLLFARHFFIFFVERREREGKKFLGARVQQRWIGELGRRALAFFCEKIRKVNTESAREFF